MLSARQVPATTWTSIPPTPLGTNHSSLPRDGDLQAGHQIPEAVQHGERLIRSIKSRYRAQAFLFLAYHFFLSSPLHLDVFIVFFILVSNFMNRDQAFPSQLLVDGLRFLLDERRFIMP
jgi:hypothetical protein